MDNIDNDLVRELRAQFCQEGTELLERVEASLLTLEKGFETSVFESLLRDLHCLKGSSRAVGFEAFSKIVHALESKFKSSDQEIGSLIDKTLQTVDLLKEFITEVSSGSPLEDSESALIRKSG